MRKDLQINMKNSKLHELLKEYQNYKRNSKQPVTFVVWLRSQKYDEETIQYFIDKIMETYYD